MQALNGILLRLENFKRIKLRNIISSLFEWSYLFLRLSIRLILIPPKLYRHEAPDKVPQEVDRTDLPLATGWRF